MISINSKEIPLNKALQWANHPMTRAMLGAPWSKLALDIEIDYGLRPVLDSSVDTAGYIKCALGFGDQGHHNSAVVESFPGRGAPKPLCLDCAIRHSDAFGPDDVVLLVSR